MPRVKRVVLGEGEAYGTSTHYYEEKERVCDCCGDYLDASLLGKSRRKKILRGWESVMGKKIRLIAEIIEPRRTDRKEGR